MKECCPQCRQEIPEGSPFGFCPRCGLGGSDGGDDLIEGIELGELLGKGSFGEVYAGVILDHSLREVAVKILGEAGFERSRFLEEMQILTLLQHRNIARLTGSGETRDGRPYYHMELIEGVPLDAYEGDVLPVMTQVAEAVAYAHRNGVIHRDLKPGNVLVTSEGEVKVIDFGIARVVSGPLALAHGTTQNVRMGTPLYMSPEQLEGDPQIDTRADVFALGLLFYELCLGSPVLDGVVSPEKSWTANAEAVKGFRFPKLEPREYQWVGRKACAFDKEERYSSVEEFLRDLKSLERGTLVSAGVKSRAYLARRFVKKYRKGLVFLAVLMACLVAISALSFSMARRDREAREEIGNSMVKVQLAERETRVAAADARLREANVALEKEDAVEALRITELALELDPRNDEAIYFRNFLLATRALPRRVSSPTIDFKIESIERHDEGFLLIGDGRERVVACKRRKISHPKKDVVMLAGRGMVHFRSRASGESLVSPVIYDSREGLVCFSDRRGTLATVTSGSELALWDVSGMRTPGARRVVSPAVTWLGFEREKETLWMVGEAADLHFWPSWSGPLNLGEIEGYGDEFFKEVSMKNRRDYLWTFWQGGNQRGLAGGKMDNLRALRSISQHTKKTGTSIRITTMARDRDLVLFVDSAGAIAVRNDRGEFEFLPGPVKPVRRLAVSAEGGLAAVVFKDGEVATFDPAKREFGRRWDPGGVPRCVVIPDDEEKVVVGFEDGSIRSFDSRDGRELGGKIVTDGEGLEVAVVPHCGEILTRADGDLEVKRWELGSGRLLNSGMRHVDGVLWFSCSLDGKFLFSIDQKEQSAERGFLRVWSLRSGQEIVPALVHEAALNCATIYDNGRKIATACADGTVRRWSITQAKQ